MKDPAETWARVIEARPSKHLPKTPSGFRRELMEAYPGGRYLEIGTRRGHSLAARMLHAGGEAVSIDLYIPNYADEPNLGAEDVRAFLNQLGVDSNVALATGESRLFLPLLSDQTFDVILVDGDHTPEGALDDLRNAFRLLAPSGMLFFDDADETLMPVLREAVERFMIHGVTDEHPAADGAEPWARVMKFGW